jgi:DNA adenine methylase
MTAYHGGKQKIGKELAQVIYKVALELEEDEGFEIKGYCEPFCGMLGVYQHIPELFEDHKPGLKYKAGDLNRSVVMMWQEAQLGWIPPTTCSKEKYQRLRYNDKDSAEKGFIGHQFSFGGIYFGSFAPNYGKSKNQKKASDTVIKIGENLESVSFSYGNYEQFSKLKNYVIYCDPPYTGTAQKYNETFNTEDFWDWCIKMSKNNIIFVSEYGAPKPFKKIWSKTIKSGSYKGYKTNKSEKLYVI